jgi:alkylhydroperoxidase family enzyme
MRLSILDNGHRLRVRLFLTATARMSGVTSPDIVKMLLYRPDFFARALLGLTAPAMRGPSYWTAGEREYLAMSTAELHRCAFCQVTHTELTRLAANGEIDPDDPASARPDLRTVRQFLDTVTRTPDEAEAVALPGQAVLEALHVNLVWNIVNRLANAFGFELLEGQLESGTRSLHRFGYRFPGFLLAGGDRTNHGGLVENLRYSVFESPAKTAPELRKSAATGESLAEPWQTYAAMVRDQSYRIADTDINRLKASGHSEDEIFEITVAATVGAALRSFDAGRRLVQVRPLT